MNITYLKDEELQVISGGNKAGPIPTSKEITIALGNSGYELVIDYAPFAKQPQGAIELFGNKKVEVFLEEAAIKMPVPQPVSSSN